MHRQMPTDAPGWIVARYNDLTQVCVGATAPAEAAPSTSG
jgi:membrane protein required for colicin V production